MQENFIPHYSLKPLIAAEEAPREDIASHEDISSVVMASFDTFHGSPDQGRKSSDKEQDYQAGFAAGKAEASTVYEATIKLMEVTLESLKSGFQKQVSEIEESHAQLVLRCLEAVLPELSNSILISELQKIMSEACGQNLTESVTLRLHPHNTIVKEFLAKQSEGMFQITEDGTQTETGVTVCWENSRTEIDPMAVANACLSRLGGQTIIKKTKNDLGANHE